MDERRKRVVRASNFTLDFDSTSKQMDGLDSNIVLEVPDTPDRLATGRLVGRSPSCDPVRRARIACSRQSNQHTLIRNSDTSMDSDFFFKEANLARQLSNNTGTKPSSESQSRPLEPGHVRRSNGILRSRETTDLSENRIALSPSIVEDKKIEKLYEDTAGLNSRDKGKGLDLCSNSKHRNACISSSSLDKTDSSFEAGSQKFTNSIDGFKCSSSIATAGRDNEKVVDLCRDSELINGQPRRPRSAQRRLVRNGCISPLNIERHRNFGKQKEGNIGNDGSLSHQVQIISPDSQEKRFDKMKGKVTAEDIVASSKQSVKGRSHVNSASPLPGKEVMAISCVEGGNSRSEEEGWITTRNHMRQPSTFPTRKTDNILNSEDAFSHPFNGSHEVAMANESSVDVLHVDTKLLAMQHGTNSIQDSQELRMESRRINGKRRLDSSHFRDGECSSSSSNDPESLNLRSSRQRLNSRSNRSHRSWRDGLVLDQVIEVDELQSPEAISNSVDWDRQVEADEMLARQLQEELYNETPRSGNTNEIDASLALLLQENDGHNARRNRTRRRDLSSSSIRSRIRQHLQNPGRGANPARAPTSTRLAQMRRDLQMRMVDLDWRLDIIGGAALGGGAARVNNFLHIQRDFNEDDYEMLLALDDNNHQHGGASESQINNLPQSVIQNVDSQEACAVCLEAPSVGDTIRHLPCLHKFHKDCIDAWLRRKRLCPICKNDIR